MKHWISELKCGDAWQFVLQSKRTLDIYRTSSPETLDDVSRCRTPGVFITGRELDLDKLDSLSSEGAEVVWPAIDASMLNGTPRHRAANQFCAALIGALDMKVRDTVMSRGGMAGLYDQDEYFDSLRQVSEALKGAQEAAGLVGIDAIYACQHALDLGNQLHRHFRLVSRKLFEGRMLCFLVDGIDFAISNGWPILESMRRNLASPYAVGVVHAGDDALEAISMTGPAVAPDVEEKNEDDDNDW